MQLRPLHTSQEGAPQAPTTAPSLTHLGGVALGAATVGWGASPQRPFCLGWLSPCYCAWP